MLLASLVILGPRPRQTTLLGEGSHQKSNNILNLAFVLVASFVAENISLVLLEVLGVLRLLVLNVAVLFDLVEADVKSFPLNGNIGVLGSTRTIRSLEANKRIHILFNFSRILNLIFSQIRLQNLQRLDFTELLKN